jgi:hypothetical protein
MTSKIVRVTVVWGGSMCFVRSHSIPKSGSGESEPQSTSRSTDTAIAARAPASPALNGGVN